MPRIVDITVRSDRTAALVDELRGLQGVLGLRLQGGASLEPPGDLVTVQVINRAMPALVQLVQRHGIGDAADGSFSTAEPVSIVPSASKSAVVEDSSEASRATAPCLPGPRRRRRCSSGSSRARSAAKPATSRTRR